MALQTECVAEAVLRHLGPTCQVSSWKKKDFTKKGDHYAMVVTSVELQLVWDVDQVFKENNGVTEDQVPKQNHGVNSELRDDEIQGNTIHKLNNSYCDNYSFIQKENNCKDQRVQERTAVNKFDDEKICKRKNVTYVVKFLPDRPDGPFRNILANLHRREGEFFLNITPRLNAVLESLHKPLIKVPKCYYAGYEHRKELLINEDMRQYGYTMNDRKKGMNEQRTTLIMTALAHLHASSYILRKQNNNEDFEVTYPFIKDLLKDPNHPDISFFEAVYQGNINGSVEMLKHAGGYEHVTKWLRGLAPIIHKLAAQLTCNEDKFLVLCHGDTWNNNFLFSGASVCLVDLQVCRAASLATDLSYFFYTSVDTTTRHHHLPAFLRSYHNAFSSLLQAAGMQMPFSLKELHKEISSKDLWGLCGAMLILPTIVLDTADAPVLNTVKDEQYEECLEKRWGHSRKMLDSNPAFRSRFLGVFDDMVASGLIPDKESGMKPT